jgi:hypothetical protein
MTQKGTHTWDIIIQYHRCPNCGGIIESREDFRYRSGKWSKDVKCDRCGHVFVLTKQRKRSFGPLIGDPQPIEMKWD